VSHGHAEQTLHTLDLEIAEWLAKADQADATPLQDGLTIPAEVQRRQERKAQLQRAKAEMEARAYARFQAEQAEHEARLARRAEAAASGNAPEIFSHLFFSAPFFYPTPDSEITKPDKLRGLILPPAQRSPVPKHQPLTAPNPQHTLM
jgi:hypothetical protein